MDLFFNINNNLKNDLLSLINPIRKEFLRGEVIFKQGDLCQFITIINRGSIIASKSFLDGHIKDLLEYKQNDTLGTSLLFSSNPFYEETYTALSLTTVTLISKEDIYNLMQINTQILQNILASLADNSLRLKNHIDLLLYKTIRSRICCFLYNEALKTDSTTFYINYSKTELAKLLNVERPSLSTELSKMIDENIIANQNKLYTIINLEQLVKEL